ncbi:tRNA-uridine aminocarboxypropyltransferase [Psychrobium sp. 1_MG-2023]|uniref:tRNA-uridine aminocarboxypropyltransferase n=1 Tax=Psychrobium sp. 1_MG-2023 TaxID=3062624 RepID=UPI000C339102|nr:tRNA-uridine aminocarboxypropyltransferase [Psychrobium sp. 1_MG-2023]MDP2562705.1 tRNA-uridine aminocarboxypropyltransferase [Psychrobium sp. 1_MG-2023]PKF54031.1 DTW domain-containing protein [Alteromonadales bacterium alter-6D02]
MSKRAKCSQCNKALVACFCHTITKQNNELNVVILQHPSEVKHARGTAKILELSLSHCQILVGEDFSDDQQFKQLFTASDKKLLLLYPGDETISPQVLSQEIAQTDQQLNDYVVIVIDGSWKKAYKIFCLNPVLAELTRIGIDVDNQSNYRIRKSSRSDSLSTLEACYTLLSQVEQKDYSSLLTSFDYMVNFQLNSMPEQVKRRY